MPRQSCWRRFGTRAFAPSARRAWDSRARSTRHSPGRARRSWHDSTPTTWPCRSGSRASAVDAAGREVAWIRPPEDDGALRRVLIRRNPFVHSSVMMRRAVVERAGGYDETLPVAQDYDLWMRMSRLARLANLSEPLVVRRLLPGRVTAMRDAERLRAEARVRWRAVRRGAYPWWCALFAARPARALAVRAAWRRALRRARGSRDHL